MAPSLRPRRSVLYLPGSNDRAMNRATVLPADVVIFDLEDAVAPDAKIESRARVCSAISSGGYAPRETVVRVNGMETPWHADDMAAAVQSGADAVLVPKVETGAQVCALVRTMHEHDAPDGIDLWAMIETPTAFLAVHEIAGADARLTSLVVGTNDLVNDMHATHVAGRHPIAPVLTLAVVAARAAGKSIFDGVYNAIGDSSGFAAEARQGREMGFDGKTVIHPSQIEPANAAFSPSPDEVAHAHKVVSTYEQACAAGDGVIVVDGRMIESLHVRDAQRLLALDALIAARDSTRPTSPEVS
jgi:citrate lyase subunit beta / citryl-CoA lyase